MRILYDYQILAQEFGGISRYFFELYKYFDEREDVDVVLPVRYANNHYFKNTIEYKPRREYGNGLINNMATINTLIQEKRAGRMFDIIHPTYYHPPYLNFFPWMVRGTKLVITAHDMIHEQFRPEETKVINNKKTMFQKADGIIAVSQHTKKDLLKWYPFLNDNKIVVIYHGNSMRDNYKRIEVPEKYLLFVGVRSDYKNFDVLLQAYSELIKCYSDLYLVCAGGGNFNDLERQKIKKLHIEERVLQKSVTDAELSFLYRKAQCFVYPSLYEGFGIPILEAFSCGCPVILSRCSCFPEIGGDAVLYFKGTDEKELYASVSSILENMDQRELLIKKGFLRLQEFNWNNATEQTYKFYRELVGEES